MTGGLKGGYRGDRNEGKIGGAYRGIIGGISGCGTVLKTGTIIGLTRRGRFLSSCSCFR